MSQQATHGFAERVQSAVDAADKLTAKLRREGGATADVTSSPEYQELVRLTVVLEVETSRILSETARISFELERTDLAGKLVSMEGAR